MADKDLTGTDIDAPCCEEVLIDGGFNQKPKTEPPTYGPTSASEEFIFEEDPNVSPEEESHEMIFDDEDLSVTTPDLDEISTLPLLSGPVHDVIAADDPITDDLPVGMGEPTETKKIAALENECEVHVQEKSALEREIVELQDSSEVNAAEKIRALENECEQYAKDNSALRREIEELALQEGVTRRAAADVAVESGKRDQKLAELEKVLDQREKELGLREATKAEKVAIQAADMKHRMLNAFKIAKELWQTKISEELEKSHTGQSRYVTVYFSGTRGSAWSSDPLKPNPPEIPSYASSEEYKIFHSLFLKIYEELKSAEETEKPKLTEEQIVSKLEEARRIARKAGYADYGDVIPRDIASAAIVPLIL
ncbi:MAG: hypothetical protein G01um101419_159 [Parcubacteria group bacterium Gr01-1014_19]|nr:MAG: hypothetical protein G01um101419_159 [Parcubacteria group bacterium Gr01-1014_19]